MRLPFDRDDYVKREEAERLAALHARSAARRVHLDLAELYALRRREEQGAGMRDN